MTSARDALKIILDSVQVLGECTISVGNSAGFTAADEIIAPENLPPFDSAGMDGFAVRLEDILRTPITLRIAGEIPAGVPAGAGPSRGEAYRIATGAMIPGSCTAVVPKEWTETSDGDTVTILREGREGLHIRKSGADAVRGSVILKKGKVIRPQEIGLLASFGLEYLSVIRHPSVAVGATGSELVTGNKSLDQGKIRDSNRPMLLSMVREAGCEAIDLGIIRDDPGETRETIQRGLAADCCITSGGVSVGDHDHVSAAMEDLGIDIRIRKVNIKPGMPMVFGMKDHAPVFGLPGNPVSSFITWNQFVVPVLRKMMGYDETGMLLKVRATCSEEIIKKDGKRHFIRGILEPRNGTLVVRTTGSQQSNLLTSLVQANCLIILGEEVDHVTAGEEVEVELL